MAYRTVSRLCMAFATIAVSKTFFLPPSHGDKSVDALQRADDRQRFDRAESSRRQIRPTIGVRPRPHP
ncbi:MAG TPA: hypothetical protein DCQ98_02320 [Planctomycetaceae bacterium]|nr:hypothetical protein [Planctomycetaceae bacterium]